MESEKKKKILFLITKSNWGGAQKYVHDLATALPTNRYDISVALGGNGELVSKLETTNIPVIHIPGLQRDISPRKELFSFFTILRLIRAEDPDILHVNSSKAGLLGSLAGRLLGVPKIIFTAHGWVFNEDRSRLSKFFFKVLHWFTVLLAHHTITVSNSMQKQLTWPGVQTRMQTVHNGIPTTNHLSRTDARDALTKIEPKLNTLPTATWTLTIGELHHTKGHKIVIDAITTLIKNNHRVCHIIIGTGEQKTELTHYIETKNVSKHVFLLGTLDQAAQYLTAADIFILGSRTEALGLVVIEAAQAALPIVATHVGGIPEIITDQQEGLLIPPNNSNAITQAVTQYLADPNIRIAYAQAAEQKSQQFTLTAMVEKTIAVYESN